MKAFYVTVLVINSCAGMTTCGLLSGSDDESLKPVGMACFYLALANIAAIWAATA